MSSTVPAPMPELEQRVNLRELNSFGLPAMAHHLARVRSEADVRRVVDHPRWGRTPKLVLGGGSNLVFTKDVEGLVIKVEVQGLRLLRDEADAWVIEAGAGEPWHRMVAWSQDQGIPGLENLALIPGTVGAAPVQNIGAYGVELKDRFESLDVVDLVTGRTVTLDAVACAFGYRDSVFKRHLLGKAVITRVRLRCPQTLAAGAGLPGPGTQDGGNRQPQPDAAHRFLTGCAPSAARNCQTPPSSATPAASSRTRW